MLPFIFLAALPSTWGEYPSSEALSFSQTKSATSCAQVFLPQNVNGLNGPYTFNLWALEGCAIQEQVTITLTYSFALFGIPTSTGINAGPHFVLGKATETKGTSGYTNLSFTLNRVAEAVNGELVVSLTAYAAIGFQIIGSGTLEWTDFRVDNGGDISSQIPVVLIKRSSIPSKPVLGLPTPINTSSVHTNWFPNPASEGVMTYTVKVSGSTGKVASVVVPATQTTAALEGLSPGSPYTLWLTVANASGESQPAMLLFTSRYEETGSQRNLLLEQVGPEWNPDGANDGSLQSVVPSPADMDLDGLVNAKDVLEILLDHHSRWRN